MLPSSDAERRLRELISSLAVGTRLPGERDLAEEWGLARMTARKAIEALAHDGLLERRPGSGTYVAQAPYAKTLGLSSFSDDMRSRGLEPTSQLLAFDEEVADALLAARLGIDEGTELVAFSRLRLADDQPVAVETNWIVAESVPGLGPDDLDQSLFALLAERYGIRPGEASSTIDPVLPDAATAAALGIDVNAPCLRIAMEYLDHRRRPLMAATGTYSGSRYQLNVTLTPGAFGQALPKESRR